MEKSDLLKLKREVLDLDSEAALPKHLSDAWLNMLLRDLDIVFQEKNDDHTYLTAPLALIAHILVGKNANKGCEVTVTQEELFGYIQDLRLEISLELIRRNTDITTEPATLDTIFTNRDVHVY